MKIYVDFENVAYNGLIGIENLSKKDEVVIFHGKASKPNTQRIQTTANVTYIACENGHANALDFQLITYLFAHRKNSQYIILTRDKGFDYAVMMGKKLGYNVKRETCINHIEGLPKYKTGIPSDVVSFVQKHNFKSKQELHNLLMTKYHQQGSTYYKQLKSVLFAH